MLYRLPVGSCDLLDVRSLLLQVSKSPALSARVGLTASPPRGGNPHSSQGVAVQGGRMRPTGPTHLARDALLLRDDDVFLPQSLLQSLGSQHRLAGLQSRWNAEKAGADAAGAAGRPRSRAAPARCPPQREAQDSLSALLTEGQKLNQTPPTRRKLEVTVGKTQPPHQAVNSASRLSRELLTAPLLPQRTHLSGPAWRKHRTPSSAQNHNRQRLTRRAPCTQPPHLCTRQVLPLLAILTFSRDLLALTRLSPARPTSWVNPRTGLWPQETRRSPWSQGHLLLCRVASVSSSLFSMMVCWAAAAGAPGLFPSELCKRCMWNLRCPLRLNLREEQSEVEFATGSTGPLRSLQRPRPRAPRARPTWPVPAPKTLPSGPSTEPPRAEVPWRQSWVHLQQEPFSRAESPLTGDCSRG